MWRPVALSAFLALLFVSSRSGQEPTEAKLEEPAKTDFGAPVSSEQAGKRLIDIDFARSSVHLKSASEIKAAQADGAPAATAATKPGASTLQVASVSGEAVPLPAPKTAPGDRGTRVVITQGEEKTALSADEDALRMMPPGPEFAAKVQKELARLGCYRGRVDNIWGPMSRNAVARFNRVAEAGLPLKNPTRALLSSARKAPDGYCNGGGEVANGAGTRVASLETRNDIEALKNRPNYLPPWMRGEPMPEPDANVVENESEAEPAQNNASSSQQPRATPAARPSRATSRNVQRRRVQRRQVRRRAQRSRSSFTQQLRGWPGN